jgi:hypothetical protein
MEAAIAAAIDCVIAGLERAALQRFAASLQAAFDNRLLIFVDSFSPFDEPWRTQRTGENGAW